MEIKITKEAFMYFKKLKVNVIKIDGVFNQSNEPNIHNLLQDVVNFYAITSRAMTKYEILDLWKHHHKALHITEKPDELKHSYVEQLLNKIYDKQNIHKSLIDDLFNYVNLKYLIPVICLDYSKFEKNTILDITADLKYSLNIKINDQIILMHSLGDFIDSNYKVSMKTNSLLCFAFNLDFVNDRIFDNMIDDLSQLIYMTFNTKPLITLMDNNHNSIKL